MKIALATCMAVPHSGGVSPHFQWLHNELRKAEMLAGSIVGQDVTPSDMHKAFLAIRSRGSKDRLRKRLLRETALRLTKAIDALANSADVIHCHDPLSAYSALLSETVEARNLPVIQTVHGIWSREIIMSGNSSETEFFQEASRIENFVFHSRARFIAVSSGREDTLLNDFNISRERVTVVPNGVDCDDIVALATRSTGTTRSRPYFVIPKRLIPCAGIGVAIQAIKLLATDKFDLLIAGDGPLAEELRNQSRRSGVSGQVHFAGSLSREALMPLIAGSEAIVVPSIPWTGVVEGTSIVVAEALACGIPVVASRIGGLAEVIEHESNGILVSPGDPHALAAALDRFLGMSTSERLSFRTAARSAARAKWDMGSWFRNTLGAYYLANGSVKQA
jgi:glycosyltransferase involved in cell wall biosynthesis